MLLDNEDDTAIVTYILSSISIIATCLNHFLSKFLFHMLEQDGFRSDLCLPLTHMGHCST